MRHRINRLFCHDQSTPLRWHVLDDGSGNANVIFLDALYGGPGDRAVVHCTSSGNAGGHCSREVRAMLHSFNITSLNIICFCFSFQRTEKIKECCVTATMYDGLSTTLSFNKNDKPYTINRCLVPRP